MEETTENVTTETVIESGREDGSCGSQSNGDSPSLDGSGSYGSGSSGSGGAAKSDSETNSPSLAGSGSAANFFAGMLGPNLYLPAIFNFPTADLWPSAFQMHAKAQLNEAAQQRKRTPFSIKALRSIIRQKGRSPQPILIETLKDILGLENEEEKRERLRREIVESLSALPNGFDAAALNLLNLGALSRLKESTRPHFDPFSFASLKKKKGRTTFTGRQVNELDKKFEVKKYPRSSERAELAKLLSLSETQVRIWFQNRRTKWKKQDLDAKQEASLLYTQPKYT